MCSKCTLILYYAKSSSTNNNNNVLLLLKSYNQVLQNKGLPVTSFSFKKVQATSLTIGFLLSSHFVEFLEDVLLFFIKGIISKFLLIVELLASSLKVIFYTFDFIQLTFQYRYIKVLKASIIVLKTLLNSKKCLIQLVIKILYFKVSS